VDREHIAWVGAVVVLLIAGLLIGQQFLAPSDDTHAGSFRQWFWESRSLDLAAQVGLIFVGALGIAALLPKGKEDT
jgi:Ni,Fe-hydrogenase I cytochrome b subunit